MNKRRWARPLGVLLLVTGLIALTGCQTYTPGITLPSPKYLEHPPQYIPPSPPFPLPRELASEKLGPPAMELVKEPTVATEKGERLQTARGKSEPIVPTITPVAKKGETKATITIANVLKEDVVVFRVGEKGKLIYVAKLAHGDVIDIDTKPDVRYSATFMNDPFVLEHVVKDAESTWLLREPVSLPPSPTSLRAR